MKPNVPPDNFDNPTKPDVVLTSARAKIIWGDTPASVREYLVSHGISATEADAKIKEFNAERMAEIRKVGLRNIIIGSGLLLLVGLTLYSMSHAQYSSPNEYRSGGALLLSGFYGLWKLVNGIIDLIRPQSETESITEMSG